MVLLDTGLAWPTTLVQSLDGAWAAVTKRDPTLVARGFRVEDGSPRNLAAGVELHALRSAAQGIECLTREISEGQERWRVQGIGEVELQQWTTNASLPTFVAPVQGGRSLCVATPGGSLEFVDPATGRGLARLFTPDFDWIACASTSDQQRWVGFSPDARAVEFRGQGEDWRELQLAPRVAFAPDARLRATFAAGDRSLVLEESSGDKDARLLLFHASTLELEGEVAISRSFATIAWSLRADGELLVTRSETGLHFFDRRGRVWRDAARLVSLVPDEACVATFEPEGSRLWIGTRNSQVVVLDTAEVSLVRSFDISDLDPLPIEVGSIAFSRDPARALVGSSGWQVARALSTSDFEVSWDWLGFGGTPRSLMFSPLRIARSVLVWCPADDLSAKLFDLEQGALLWEGIVNGPSPEYAFEIASGETLVVPCGLGFEGLDIGTGRRRWARQTASAGGWILSSAAGWYDGSAAALWKADFSGEAADFEGERAALLVTDPKRVRLAEAGVELAPPAPLELPELRAELELAAPVTRTLAEGALELDLWIRGPRAPAFVELLQGDRRELVRNFERVGGEWRTRVSLASPSTPGLVLYRLRATDVRGGSSGLVLVRIEFTP